MGDIFHPPNDQFKYKLIQIIDTRFTYEILDSPYKYKIGTTEQKDVTPYNNFSVTLLEIETNRDNIKKLLKV